VSNNRVAALEMALSVAMLGGFLWAMVFLIPTAIKEQDPLTLTSAVMFAALAVIAWLWIGVRVGSF
jgi:hypothetical protein